MPFYKDHVNHHLVSMLGNPKPVQKIRQRLVPLAQGTVLEIGEGPGVNFVHYDPARVSKVYALEPNPGMIRRAEQQRRRTELDVEFLDLPGERIPLSDASVDTVVSTLTAAQFLRQHLPLYPTSQYEQNAGETSTVQQTGSATFGSMR
jgi:ubiquinone/menaquinone biosynthesis C-methylase UbiE